MHASVLDLNACDPLTGGGWHSELGEPLVEDLGDDGVTRHPEVHNQDPCVGPWGVEVMLPVVKSHVNCIIHWPG